MKQSKVPKPTQIGMSIGDAYKNVGNSTDPQGSYTGVMTDKKEKPVQDADDL